MSATVRREQVAYVRERRLSIRMPTALGGAFDASLPNPDGHATYAGAILDALLCDLYPGCEVERLAGAGVGVAGSRIAQKERAHRTKRRLALRERRADLPAPTPAATRRSTARSPGRKPYRRRRVRAAGVGMAPARKGFVCADPKLALWPCRRVELVPGARSTRSAGPPASARASANPPRAPSDGCVLTVTPLLGAYAGEPAAGA
jgi:hypothetical protein